uniref:ADAMTS-like protein 1 isoform X2 n=1 Tax=Myxine glutinosa TaxID=7769 RepID=UPI00358E1C5B
MGCGNAFWTFSLWLAALLPCYKVCADDLEYVPEFRLTRGESMLEQTPDTLLIYRQDEQKPDGAVSEEEEDETDTTWDFWGQWSECSRTCDGGASYSMRRCLVGGSCVGRSIRYKSCSTEDCTSGSGDFRAQQCSAHNDVQHGGGLHEWLSVHDDPTSPCSLRCRARGSGIIVELAPKVLDGTRCYPGSLDMCISGICQAVGCDRRLGSRAREDNCGVCNGDGSSCRLVRDQYRPQPGVNKPEDTVIVIPHGSRHVKITLKGPDDLHIRTKTLQGHLGELSFMGNGSYEVENSSAVLQIFPTRKVLTIAGPIRADFTILVKDTAPGESVVLFLFYQPIPHRWRRTDFFPCSSTCGGGYQLTSAECVDVRSRLVVSDHYCNYYPENKKPKPKLRECSFDLCPASYGFKKVMPYDHFHPLPSWDMSPWTSCSTSCGGGTQTRSVACVEEDSQGLLTPVEEWKCTYAMRPPAVQPCKLFDCPKWMSQEWSPCTVTCGQGLRYRVVLCINHAGEHVGGCNSQIKPHVKEDCIASVPCFRPRERMPVEAKAPWQKEAQELQEEKTITEISEHPSFLPQSWSTCSVSCGAGQRSRALQCHVLLPFSQSVVQLPLEECLEAAGPPPPTQEPCFLVPCPADGGGHEESTSTKSPHFDWEYGGFTQCSATCAGGIQEAIVVCVNQENGEAGKESLCIFQNRPPLLQRLCNSQPCPASWHVGNWSLCSSSCGAGVQSRQVRCLRVLSHEADGTAVVADGSCSMAWPAEVEACNQRDCPPTWHTGHWNDCSASCGAGIQQRDVVCQRLMGYGIVVNINVTECSRLEKPTITRPCLLQRCSGNGKNKFPWKPMSGVMIGSEDRVYIPSPYDKIVSFPAGSIAYVFPKTTLVLKCPLQRFLRSRVRWEKDGEQIFSSPHHSLTRGGCLKIRCLQADDAGIYTCTVGTVKGSFIVKLIATEPSVNGPTLDVSARHGVKSRHSLRAVEQKGGKHEAEKNMLVPPAPPPMLLRLLATGMLAQGRTLVTRNSWGLPEKDTWSTSLQSKSIEEESEEPIEDRDSMQMAESWTVVTDSKDLQKLASNLTGLSEMSDMQAARFIALLTANAIKNEQEDKGNGQRKGFSTLEDNESSMHSDEKHFELSVEDLSRKQLLDSSRSSSNAPRIASTAHNMPWLPARPPESYSRPLGVGSNNFGQKRTLLIQRYHGQRSLLHTEQDAMVHVGGLAVVALGSRSLALLCPTDGRGKASVRWSKDGTTVVAGRRILRLPDRSLKILNPVESDAGVYTCTVSTDSGSDSESVLIAFAAPAEMEKAQRAQKATGGSSRCRVEDLPRLIPATPPGLRVVATSVKGNVVRANPGEALLIGCPVLCSTSNTIKWFWKGQPLEITPLLNTQVLASGRVLLLPSIELNWVGDLVCVVGANHVTAHVTLKITEYRWLVGNSISCSASCGGSGVARPSLQCVYNGVRPVFDSFCAGLPHPAIHSQPCNIRNCPPEWIIGPWSSCIPSCGSGIRRRSLSCQKLSASGVSLNLPMSLCPGPRPPDHETCGDVACLAWAVTPWGECTSQCVGPGLGSQYRQVLCFFPNGTAAPDDFCDPKIRPGRTQNCSLSLCNVQWHTGHWAECTASCGIHGFQSRRVVCAHSFPGHASPDHLCTWTPKPQTWRRCNIVPCMEKSDCRDSSHYCETVRRLLLCQLSSYRARCCQACHGA